MCGDCTYRAMHYTARTRPLCNTRDIFKGNHDTYWWRNQASFAPWFLRFSWLLLLTLNSARKNFCRCRITMIRKGHNLSRNYHICRRIIAIQIHGAHLSDRRTYCAVEVCGEKKRITLYLDVPHVRQETILRIGTWNTWAWFQRSLKVRCTCSLELLLKGVLLAPCHVLSLSFLFDAIVTK